MSDWTGWPFERAVAHLRGLGPMSEDDYATVLALESRQAFTVSRVMKLTQIQAFIDATVDAAQRGQTPEEFAAGVAAMELGISSDQVGQVVAENVQRAYGAGSWDFGVANG